MKALVERNAARGLRAIGITKHAEDETERADVERVAKEHAMTAPTYLDPTGAWCHSAGVMLEPTFLLLDKQGRLAYRHTGKLATNDEAFAKMSSLIEKM